MDAKYYTKIETDYVIKVVEDPRMEKQWQQGKFTLVQEWNDALGKWSDARYINNNKLEKFLENYVQISKEETII